MKQLFNQHSPIIPENAYTMTLVISKLKKIYKEHYFLNNLHIAQNKMSLGRISILTFLY